MQQPHGIFQELQGQHGIRQHRAGKEVAQQTQQLSWCLGIASQRGGDMQRQHLIRLSE